MLTFPGGSDGKESACNAGDLGSTPGFRRSPGEGNGYPLQYPGLENSMDCIVHEVARVGHNWVTFTFTVARVRQHRTKNSVSGCREAGEEWWKARPSVGDSWDLTGECAGRIQGPTPGRRGGWLISKFGLSLQRPQGPFWSDSPRSGCRHALGAPPPPGGVLLATIHIPLNLGGARHGVEGVWFLYFVHNASVINHVYDGL